MPRDPLAWLPLLRHWTHCLGEGSEAIAGMGDLAALADLDMAALLPGGPGWANVQRCLRHDPEGAFRLLYYGLALRGLEELPAPALLVAPESSAVPQVTVLIPVHNHWPITLNALRSLVAMANGTSFEVIVADDASSDATTQLGRQLPWLRIWRSEHNQGFLDTCNGAAALARGEVLLLLNNDVLVGDHCLDRLWDTFQRHPEAGVVGAAAWDADGRPQEVGGIVWADGQVWNHGRGFGPEHWFALEYERQTDYVSGCALAIQQPLWQKLGGFDRHYCPAYCEDTDLCLRVRQAGQTVWVQPQARILHLEGLSHSRDASQGLKQHQLRNLEQLRERWQPLLDTQQPPRGHPWLLAADRLLLGRPLALLLQPGAEDETICQQRGWVPLVLREDCPLEWLMDHLTGPLLPEIALVGVVPAGRAIPEGWLQQEDATHLPLRPVGAARKLPALPGWDREDLRILASSSGLHDDGWLEAPSRLVIQLLGEEDQNAALRLGLYLPEQGLQPGDLKVLMQLETANETLSQVLKPGLNPVVVQRHAASNRSTLVISLDGEQLVRPANPNDQRRLMAVLVDLEPCPATVDTVASAVSQSVA
jgi:GT2 family glycosyltransferase